MKLEFGQHWSQKLKGRIERHQFLVGVLEDKPHKDALENPLFGEPKLGSYAGGPVRKTGNTASKTNAQVLVENMKRLNIDILRRPFQDESSDLMKFSKYFLKYVSGSKGVSINRVINLIQAIVRNPILKQEYGQNKAHTADAKGFDRHLIDTGQMFRSIKVRAKRV